MNTLVDNNSTNGDTLLSKEIIDGVIGRIDVERIYLNQYEMDKQIQRELVIFIANSCTTSPNEPAPLIEIFFHGQEEYRFKLFPSHHAKEAMRKGNLYFYSVGTDDKLIYRKAGSNYELLPEGIEAIDVYKKSVQQYEAEAQKIEAFYDGAKFYYEQENYQQAAFMLHQVIELTYRAAEQFVIGKSKFTHSIKTHQRYMGIFSPQLGTVFSEQDEEDIALLKLLDKAYLAVRYDNNYQISKPEALSLKMKASLTKVAASETHMQMVNRFMQASQYQLDRLEQAESIAKKQVMENPTENPPASPQLAKVQENTKQQSMEMETNSPKNKDFQAITQIITSTLDTERIYCFGHREHTATQSALLGDSVIRLHEI